MNCVYKLKYKYYWNVNCVYKLSYKNYYYIGSTENFDKRLIRHKHDCFNKNRKCYNCKEMKKFRELGLTKENFYKDIKYKFLCILNSNKKLTEYENIFINLKDEYCLNTKKENQNSLNEDGSHNKDYFEEYYKKNKEKILKKQNETNEKNKNDNKLHCSICNIYLSSMSNLKHHYKSKRHLNNGVKVKIKQKKVECPHCYKKGGISNMKRYHFNNCKKKN